MQPTVSLSTPSSRLIYGKAMRVLLFISVFFALNLAAGRELNATVGGRDVYARLKWNEFYAAPRNSIDVVFLGSSLAYRSFDPAVFDTAYGTSSMNMGSPLQNPAESYYILREVLKYQQPRLVVLDVYWGVYTGENYFDTKVWTYDMLRPSLNKAAFLFNAFRPEDYARAAMYTVRYHDRIDRYLPAKAPAEQAKKAAEMGHYSRLYKGKGFIINDEKLDVAALRQSYADNPPERAEFAFDGRQLNYLQRIADLCAERGVRLVLVSAPIAPTYLELLEEYKYQYGPIHDRLEAVARQNGLEYFDYNIINREQKMLADQDYGDMSHVNYRGAQKLSGDLAARLRGYLE